MVTEFCLTEAARVGQNSLKDRPKVAWRTGDRAEYLGGRRLLLQRLGKVPPHLGELTGARVELLFQLAQRIGRSNEACGRALDYLHLCETRSPRRHSDWSPFAPIAGCELHKSPILPELCRIHLGLLDAGAEFGPGILVLL